MASPRTLLDKLWDEHVVVPASDDAPAVLAIDLHLVHEVTSPQAFDTLRERGLSVRRPDRTLATMDHSTPTLPKRADGSLPVVNEQAGRQIDRLVENCRAFGVTLHGYDSPNRGIVHVMGPDLGATQPGMTIVCGDSHTSTHGAFGSLAFGIGTSEVTQVLATQCLLQRKAKAMAVDVDGELPSDVDAKDLILAIIAELGVGGGTGCVLEYRGEAVRSLSMEGRMTVCNMSIEAGARAGMIAPDAVTIEYLRDRAMAPAGEAWERAVDRWRRLPTDEGAAFDRTARVDACSIEPMITWGTNPGAAVRVSGVVPEPADRSDEKALAYMGFEPGQAMAGKGIDTVFIGSCTNSRIEDLRAAAEVMRGRAVASGVRTLIVPGSGPVKQQAENEGLADVFVKAGAEWREPGCSMCIAMNGDRVGAGELAVSTSNRNFEGRQGAGARTMLASPRTAAACAVAGEVVDPREFTRSPVGAGVGDA
ncbi:MAG: 3-isopropylmalate dehydratase large subunit [Planctomycetota bacterium]